MAPKRGGGGPKAKGSANPPQAVVVHAPAVGAHGGAGGGGGGAPFPPHVAPVQVVAGAPQQPLVPPVPAPPIVGAAGAGAGLAPAVVAAAALGNVAQAGAPPLNGGGLPPPGAAQGGHPDAAGGGPPVAAALAGQAIVVPALATQAQYAAYLSALPQPCFFCLACRVLGVLDGHGGDAVVALGSPLACPAKPDGRVAAGSVWSVAEYRDLIAQTLLTDAEAQEAARIAGLAPLPKKRRGASNGPVARKKTKARQGPAPYEEVEDEGGGSDEEEGEEEPVLWTDIGQRGMLRSGQRAFDFDPLSAWESVNRAALDLRAVPSVAEMSDGRYQDALRPLVLVLLGLVSECKEGLALASHPTTAGMESMWGYILKAFYPGLEDMPGVATPVARLGHTELVLAVASLCSSSTTGRAVTVRYDAERASRSAKARGSFGVRNAGDGGDSGDDMSDLLHGAPPDMSKKAVGYSCSFRPPSGKLSNYVRLACSGLGFPLGRGSVALLRADFHSRALAARLRVPRDSGVTVNEVFRGALKRFAASGVAYNSLAADDELLSGCVPKLSAFINPLDRDGRVTKALERLLTQQLRVFQEGDPVVRGLPSVISAVKELLNEPDDVVSEDHIVAVWDRMVTLWASALRAVWSLPTPVVPDVTPMACPDLKDVAAVEHLLALWHRTNAERRAAVAGAGGGSGWTSAFSLAGGGFGRAGGGGSAFGGVAAPFRGGGAGGAGGASGAPAFGQAPPARKAPPVGVPPINTNEVCWKWLRGSCTVVNLVNHRQHPPGKEGSDKTAGLPARSSRTPVVKLADKPVVDKPGAE